MTSSIQSSTSSPTYRTAAADVAAAEDPIRGLVCQILACGGRAGGRRDRRYQPHVTFGTARSWGHSGVAVTVGFVLGDPPSDCTGLYPDGGTYRATVGNLGVTATVPAGWQAYETSSTF